MTTKISDQILPIPPKKEPKLQPKTLEAMKLVDAGLTPREALQVTNFKKNISSAGIAVFKNKYKKHSLTAPATVKLASHQVKRILAARAREEAHTKIGKDGQVIDYTDNIYPTDSNILAAAEMVYDRYEPVHSQEQAPPGGNMYIDLSSYQVSLSTGSDNVPCDRQVVDMVEDKL